MSSGSALPELLLRLFFAFAAADEDGLGRELLSIHRKFVTGDTRCVDDHGSTFGGNELAANVGMEALNTIVDEQLTENSATLGEEFLAMLQTLDSPIIKDVRGRGLFIGMEIDPQYYSARDVAMQLLANGILSKETHATVVRLAPPLIITREQITDAFNIIKHTITAMTEALPQ